MNIQEKYQREIGGTITELRVEKGLTQAQLAKSIGTSQSAVNRIEKGRQNISLEMISKISSHLGTQILSVNTSDSQGYRINGGKKLQGSIKINSSKNAAVGLLCASLLNLGKTTLKSLARIEEVFRIIEVLNSIGVKTRWVNYKKDLEIIAPRELNLDGLDLSAARKTRSIIMLMGPLLHKFQEFRLPYAGGCSLGSRTVEPHLRALKGFGLEVDAFCNSGFYEARVHPVAQENKRIVLTERGDTVTENAVMAASLCPYTTTIIGASSNYMVQDVCFFLQKLGVKIEGIGTTTLKITGKPNFDADVEYAPSEDPIEAMSFIAAGVVTKSEITVKRAPIEFLEIELEVMRSMGMRFKLSDEYLSKNGITRLVDISLMESQLVAPIDKIHPMPFPGLNIDNLPFFSLIAASAEGRTLIHDWVFENRAIYTTELSRLNASVQLLDAHRIFVNGPTNWRPAEMIAPPALRPAVVILLAMLAAPGKSVLRNVYSIARGYQDFAERLKFLGADIEPLSGI